MLCRPFHFFRERHTKKPCVWCCFFLNSSFFPVHHVGCAAIKNINIYTLIPKVTFIMFLMICVFKQSSLRHAKLRCFWCFLWKEKLVHVQELKRNFLLIANLWHSALSDSFPWYNECPFRFVALYVIAPESKWTTHLLIHPAQLEIIYCKCRPACQPSFSCG